MKAETTYNYNRRSRVRALTLEYGARMVWAGPGVIEIEAPQGCVWTHSRTRRLRASLARFETWPGIYAALLPYVERGLSLERLT